MGAWQLLLVGLVMAMGLLGVLVPGVPGTAVVWASVLWWALSDLTALAWWVLIGATVLLLLTEALKWMLPPRRMREAGAPRRTLQVGGLAAIGGFFLLPVIGFPLGFVGGIYVVERLRLGSHGNAAASTRTVMRTIGLATMVELFACLLVVGCWAGALIWS